VVDPGGAITIHLFGGMFGLLVAVVIGVLVKPETTNNEKEALREDKPSYFSSYWSFIGALFIFIMFPSFNAAFAPAGTQHRVILTTVYALTSASITAFVIARFYHHREGFRLNLNEIRDAIVAGGISVACAHSYSMPPYGGTILGAVAAILTLLGHWFIAPAFVNSKVMFFFDVRGAFYRHAIPGLLAAVASSIALAAYKTSGTTTGGQLYDSLYPQGNNQALRQFFGWLITIFLAPTAGALTGAVIWLLIKLRLVKSHRKFFAEEYAWSGLPHDYDFAN